MLPRQCASVRVPVCVCECERVAILMCVLFMKIHFCIHSTATKNVDHKVFCILSSLFSLLSLFLLLLYSSYLCASFCSFVFGFVWVSPCPFPARRLTHGWRLSRSARTINDARARRTRDCPWGNNIFPTNFVLSRFYWR